MRKASYRKLAEYVADFQENLEILQAKKEYINNMLNKENLEIFAENQIKDKTIELLVAEKINQKMKKIQDNWKKKENFIKNDNKISRLMRVVSIENDNCKYLKNEVKYEEDLKNAEQEVEILSCNLKQIFEVVQQNHII
ncbi:37065_t:CDS:2 [Gigaspora margarita]|uniref:37065_t:CDS:1 n=1 Tax=Gigaspora margarita TaxID=4874 RepID=A0ABN7W1F8_GIGMA|nr:37065_t:CDS:2 [Gigaspora margarita]